MRHPPAAPDFPPCAAHLNFLLHLPDWKRKGEVFPPATPLPLLPPSPPVAPEPRPGDSASHRLFTTMICGSPLATANEDKWLHGADGTRPLVLPNISNVRTYNDGFEDFQRGRITAEAAANPAAARLPEEPLRGKPRYGYIYEDPVRGRFATAGTLMEITAYDTTDRRTLEVWSRAVAAFEVVRVVQLWPYPIAEVRLLSGAGQGAESDGGKGDEDAYALEQRIRAECADLFFKALEVNTDRVRLTEDLKRMVGSITREVITSQPLNVLAAFVLRNTPNASIDFLCSTSRWEQLGIMDRVLKESKQVVELGFDYFFKKQADQMFQRFQLSVIILGIFVFTAIVIGNQANSLDQL